MLSHLPYECWHEFGRLILWMIIDKGLSVVLIERGEGVETTPIKTAYSAAAGTA